MLVVKGKDLKEKLDNIDKQVEKVAIGGYYMSRRAIKCGQWWKGKIVDSEFTGGKIRNYLDAQKQTGKNDKSLKKWHKLYKNNLDYDKWLKEEAEPEALEWTRKVFDKLKAKQLEEAEIPELPEGKYQVIYADPPWKYGQDQHSKEEQETVLGTHYPSMETDDICKMKVEDLTGDNAVLFLWTTSPKLYEAKKVIDAWGFEYKASMIWDKVKHNVGYYVSVRHEILLICTKGSCLPDNPKLHDSVVTEERTEHSKKPSVFYEIIEDIYKGKKVELFARNKRDGWASMGNQL